jgi:membrane-bound lytic murein transglycosylase F
MCRIQYILVLALTLISCQGDQERTQAENNPQDEFKTYRGIDLESIKARGVLKAMTTYSATSYFLYRGAPMGYEYELMKRFSEYLDVELEIVVSDNIDSMFYHLNTGNVDLVAHGLTITQARKEEVSFSDYLYLVNQVLVQRKPNNWRKMHWSAIERNLINDPIELIGETVSVRQNSSVVRYT